MRGKPGAEDPQLVDLVRRDVRRELGAPGAEQRELGALLELVEVAWERSPVDQAAARDPERVERSLGRVPREDQPGSRMRGLEQAVEPREQHARGGARGVSARRRVRTAGPRRPRASADGRGRSAVARSRRRRGTTRAPHPAGGGRDSGRDRRGTATDSAPSDRRRTGDRGAPGDGRSGAGRTASPAARPARPPAVGRAAARS